LKTWMKVSAAVLITAMICVPVAATMFADDTETLNVAGSTTVQPLMIELQKDFEKFANVNMNVTGGGSGVGVSSTLNGVADIGMLSRNLKSGEGGGKLVPHVIALDAVVVIVNASAGLTATDGVYDLTLDQISKIYSGEFTRWSDLGGADIPIAVIAREEGSGTRDCFDSKLNAKVKEKDVMLLNNTNAVLTAVNDINGSIGYVNFNVSGGLQSNTVKVIVNGVEATAGTISNKTYPISRELILVTNGTETGMVKFFIDWVLSKDGQDIIEKAGFVKAPPKGEGG